MGEGSERDEQRVVGGRYVVHEPIGTGGTATVHFARLVSEGGFSRILAIKRLRRELVSSPEFVNALVDEARLASRIRHPNVVAPVDLVVDEGEIFVVMDYVAGASLAELMTLSRENRKRIAPRLGTAITTNILYALEAAHRAADPFGRPLGIVHRDVSPQNILVGVDGVSRLLDFGVAKGRGRISTSRAGQVKGRLGYTAPELLTGEEPNPRSDIYAAAVVLWEALTGRRLFEPADPEIIRQILEADLKPPSHHVPKLPGKLDALVMRGLNRAPEARYESAIAFATAIEETVGVATPRRVGDWVRRVAAAVLKERACLFREVEVAAAEGDDAAVQQLLRATLPSRPPPEEAPEDEGGMLDPPTEIDEPEGATTMPAPGFDPKRTRVVGGAASPIVKGVRRHREPKRAVESAERLAVSDPLELRPERRLDGPAETLASPEDPWGGDDDENTTLEVTQTPDGRAPLAEPSEPKGDELRRAQMDMKEVAALAGAVHEAKRSAPPDAPTLPSAPASGSSFALEDIELPVSGGNRFWIALAVFAIVIGAALLYRFA